MVNVLQAKRYMKQNPTWHKFSSLSKDTSGKSAIFLTRYSFLLYFRSLWQKGRFPRSSFTYESLKKRNAFTFCVTWRKIETKCETSLSNNIHVGLKDLFKGRRRRPRVEEKGGEGRGGEGRRWKEKDKGIKEMGRKGVGSKLRGGSVNKLRRTENNWLLSHVEVKI